RHLGTTQVPARIRVGDYAQAWRFLGVTAQVREYEQLLHASRNTPAVREWALSYPLHALEHAPSWDVLIAAVGWLEQARGSQKSIREVTAPGVDTKFIEEHRKTLAQILAVPANKTGFLE